MGYGSLDRGLKTCCVGCFMDGRSRNRDIMGIFWVQKGLSRENLGLHQPNKIIKNGSWSRCNSVMGINQWRAMNVAMDSTNGGPMGFVHSSGLLTPG